MSEAQRPERLAPEFQVKINANAVPAEMRADLISASVLDDVDAAGMCCLTLHGWDVVKMEPKWIDDDLFREGNPIEIQMGYESNVKPIFKGEITALEPAFHEGEPPTLTVRGHDKRHRLLRQRRTRTFMNMQDSEIADRVASEAGLGADVETTSFKNPYVIQRNQTDLDFLLERAQRIGFEVFVDDKTMHFRSRGIDRKEVIKLRRDVELLEFLPRLSSMGQVSEIVVRGWDPTSKKEIVARSSSGRKSATMGGSTSGPRAVQQSFGDDTTVRVDTPVHTQEDADDYAKGLFAEMALGYIRAEGVCIGEPALRAGSNVQVEGIGRRFSGLYYVTSVVHKYSSKTGYRTDFSARRNAT
jgi:uncharacterized protein